MAVDTALEVGDVIMEGTGLIRDIHDDIKPKQDTNEDEENKNDSIDYRQSFTWCYDVIAGGMSLGFGIKTMNECGGISITIWICACIAYIILIIQLILTCIYHGHHEQESNLYKIVDIFKFFFEYGVIVWFQTFVFASSEKGAFEYIAYHLTVIGSLYNLIKFIIIMTRKKCYSICCNICGVFIAVLFGLAVFSFYIYSITGLLDGHC